MLTIKEIREICNADVDNLPPLLVHDLEFWTGDVMVDSKGRLHMNALQLAEIRLNLPVREVGRRGPSTIEYAIDIQQHHLIAGMRDFRAPARDKKARQNVKRRLTGAEEQ